MPGWSRFRDWFFFGNYFYALCVLGLAIESSLQLGLRLPSWLFYATLVTSSVGFYTKAYLQEYEGRFCNARTNWYKTHLPGQKRAFSLMTVMSATLATIYLFRFGSAIGIIPVNWWLFCATFPVAGLAYYGMPGFHLRNTGWLKPFLIGWVWAGATTALPVMAGALEHGVPAISYPLWIWFFTKNWMFITVLAILFDIKDYATDSNKHLKTFVVRVGLRDTIFRIVMPLTVIGFLAFLGFAWMHSQPLPRVLINSIPFVLLVAVTRSLHHRKSILYYLAIIDGLMLVKACCGIAGAFIIR